MVEGLNLVDSGVFSALCVILMRFLRSERPVVVVRAVSVSSYSSIITSEFYLPNDFLVIIFVSNFFNPSSLKIFLGGSICVFLTFSS